MLFLFVSSLFQYITRNERKETPKNQIFYLTGRASNDNIMPVQFKGD